MTTVYQHPNGTTATVPDGDYEARHALYKRAGFVAIKQVAPVEKEQPAEKPAPKAAKKPVKK